MILLGTSGYSYDDWKGRWYPPDLPRNQMFDYYAERFNAVEINSTYYRIPGPQMMQSLVRRARGRVTFSIKMASEVTHKGDLSPKTVRAYCLAVAPAAEASALGAILFQFPYRFHDTAENRAYLERAIGLFSEYTNVVEIRHASWQSEDALGFFRDLGVSLCITDMPRLNKLPQTNFALTGPIAYFRFHGRNSANWFTSDNSADPYDYLYKGEELAPWVEPIQEAEKQADTTFAFFNNHVHGQAPANAYQLAEMLGAGPKVEAYEDLFGGIG